MDEKEFRRSYTAEDALLGSGIAPDMEVRTAGGTARVPVRIMAVMMNAYRNTDMENPLQQAASVHEITFGVVCEDGELDTVAMLTSEYARAAGENQRAGKPVSLRAVAEAIRKLASICGEPGMEGSLHFCKGSKLLDRHGPDTAAAAAVLQVQEEINRIALERGEEHWTTLGDMVMRAEEG